MSNIIEKINARIKALEAKKAPAEAREKARALIAQGKAELAKLSKKKK